MSKPLRDIVPKPEVQGPPNQYTQLEIIRRHGIQYGERMVTRKVKPKRIKEGAGRVLAMAGAAAAAGAATGAFNGLGALPGAAIALGGYGLFGDVKKDWNYKKDKKTTDPKPAMAETYTNKQRISDLVKSARGYNQSVLDAKKVGSSPAHSQKFRDLAMSKARALKIKKLTEAVKKRKLKPKGPKKFKPNPDVLINGKRKPRARDDINPDVGPKAPPKKKGFLSRFLKTLHITKE